MSTEEDDKPTVVLDFNSLKEDLEQSEELTSGEIKFNVAVDDSLDESLNELDELTEDTGVHEDFINIYLLEYKVAYFQKVMAQQLDNKFIHLIDDLKQLNKALTEDPQCVVALYYNGAPKAINQLSLQIKAKFPKAKTIIVAKKLSPEKAAKHAQTKYGAHGYLNHPFDINTFFEKVNEIVA